MNTKGMQKSNATAEPDARSARKRHLAAITAATVLSLSSVGGALVAGGGAASASPAHPAAVAAPIRAAASGWTWYGYKLSWSGTVQIASLSLANAASGVQGSSLIPYSAWIMRLYAIDWVLTARNARDTGRCLAISWGGTGLIVGC